MMATPRPTFIQTHAGAAAPVADADLAETWQALAEVAPHHPYAPEGEQLDALAWRAALLDAHAV